MVAPWKMNTSVMQKFVEVCSLLELLHQKMRKQDLHRILKYFCLKIHVLYQKSEQLSLQLLEKIQKYVHHYFFLNELVIITGHILCLLDLCLISVIFFTRNIAENPRL